MSLAMTALDFEMPPQPIRPWAALKAAWRLLRDNQDTEQVVLLSMALTGRSQRPVFERFAASPAGQRVIAERRSLTAALDDYGRLRRLPPNSLGRRYLAFMEEEGLSAQGLVSATGRLTAHLAKLPEPVALYVDYAQRGAHDLYHVLAGYGRDELGEVCVLAMSNQQLRIRGFAVITALGPFAVRRHLRRLGAATGGLGAVLAEARRIGRQAAWIPGIDLEEALGEDLDVLRRRLNIGAPHRYHALLARVRAQTGWRNGPFGRATQPGSR